MSSGDGVKYCPYRTSVGWTDVQVSDFSTVNYFQASESEGEYPDFQGD